MGNKPQHTNGDAFAEALADLAPAPVPQEVERAVMARCEVALLHGIDDDKPAVGDARSLVDRIWRPFWVAAACLLVASGAFWTAARIEHGMNRRLISLRYGIERRNEAMGCLSSASWDGDTCRGWFERPDAESIRRWSRHMRRMAAGEGA